jgi:hypothetical protein
MLDVEGDGVAEEDDQDDGQADRQEQASRIAPDVERLLPGQGDDAPDHAVLAPRIAATNTCSKEALSAPVKRTFNSRGDPRAMIAPA